MDGLDVFLYGLLRFSILNPYDLKTLVKTVTAAQFGAERPQCIRFFNFRKWRKAMKEASEWAKKIAFIVAIFEIEKWRP